MIDEMQHEGEGINFSHAFLLLDGSGSMTESELRSGKPKHKAVADMVQNLINELHDGLSIINTQLTIICYDSNKVDDIRLQGHDVKSDAYYNQNNQDVWDPLRGHNGATPIGRALAFGRELAEQWVTTAPGMEVRRAVIYLISDGMNYPDTESNGMDEKKKIKKFNDEQAALKEQGGFKGKISIATVGYFQYPAGTKSEEDKGRELLKSLPINEKAYFETDDAEKIAAYIVRTLS